MAELVKCFVLVFYILIVFNEFGHGHSENIEFPDGIPVPLVIESTTPSMPTKPPSSVTGSFGDRERLNLGYNVLRQNAKIQMSKHSSSNRLEVFCYSGETKSVYTIFKTVEVHINCSDSFRFYEGHNATAVRQLFATSSWFSFTPWKPSAFLMDLYNKSCIGFETGESYEVGLKVKAVDIWRVALCVFGVVLFFHSERMACNLLFHYFTGSLIGVLGSFLIIVVLLARYIPKRTGALTFFLGGSGVFLYILQLMYTNAMELVTDYYHLLAGYVCVTGLVSFAVVYRWGGVANPRSLQLLTWSLQLCALIGLYCCTQYKEASVTCIAMLLAHRILPRLRLPSFVVNYWSRRASAPPKLLSEEEYMEQSVLETTQALTDLRDYCRSPKCDTWKTLSRLKSPNRFVEFVEGSNHVQEAELRYYDSESPLLYTDDEDNDSDGRLTDDCDDGAGSTYSSRSTVRTDSRQSDVSSYLWQGQRQHLLPNRSLQLPQQRRVDVNELPANNNKLLGRIDQQNRLTPVVGDVNSVNAAQYNPMVNRTVDRSRMGAVKQETLSDNRRFSPGPL